MSDFTERAYAIAQEQYAAVGVDTRKAMEALMAIPISLNCWQGDDVRGFENPDADLSGGIQATGSYPGRARNADELRSDLETALRLIPGKHRLNLHAIYLENNGQPVGRERVALEHFTNWIDWARDRKMGLDFNPTFFSHPMADDGFTLSHPDKAIRDFWVEHGKACRRIAAGMGEALGTPCVTNIWIPDGSKDTPVDRKSPRELLRASLDHILSESLEPSSILDCVECKLFGIGSESYVVGSHEFYLAYAARRENLLVCLDTGHFHPTELVSDKISAVLTHLPGLLLHISRGVRWDSDHVVVLSDELMAIAQEIIRGSYLDRVKIGMDYFDASINRVAAWVIGSRSILKAFLAALLEPVAALREAELQGNNTRRLALLEEAKTLPFGAVWDYCCLKNNVPLSSQWLSEVANYEKAVLSRRS